MTDTGGLPASPVAYNNRDRTATPGYTNINEFETDLNIPQHNDEQQPDRELEETDSGEPQADLGSLDQINKDADAERHAGLQADHGVRPASPVVDEQIPQIPHVEELRLSLEFIDALKRASLDDGNLDEGVVNMLRNPPQEPLDASDPDLRLSLDLFLATMNASEDSYRSAAEGICRRHPDDDILSYERIRKKVAEMSGVHPITHHMCINTCIAYTGPYSDLDKCPLCAESRYEKRCVGRKTVNIARQEFHTIPIGPLLQAFWRTSEGAQRMRHRSQRTETILAEMRANGGRLSVYDDFYHGQDYLDAVQRGDITKDDMVLVFSIDGAQLYQNKASDCWIGIWIIFDLAPDIRYQKKTVLPAFFIPGPNKPKIVDSYLLPSLSHVRALQTEGLMVWDALEDRVFESHIFLGLATADGPGMTYLNGLVGHHGAYGCRLYCAMKGRHKPGGGHYYPVLLRPDNYEIEGCDHPDIDVQQIRPASSAEYQQNLAFVLASPNNTRYKERRKDTGISKPSLFSGLLANRTLGIPGCFPADLMHLVSLNLTDLIVSLWRGTIDCDLSDDRASWDWAVLKGDTWKLHGKCVADATPYLPGSFDRPPRNPAEKISSGYKAWEFLLYIFALGPGIFYNVIPEKYWAHFCKLVTAIRIIHQRSIKTNFLRIAHKFILEFVQDFELFYYQRKTARIHFCRPCIHALPHLAPEVVRIGPGAYSTQWTMERSIGNLGEEVKQPSKPFANLSQRGILRSQVNALKAMIPDLEPTVTKLPRGAKELGGDFILLCARDENAHLVDNAAEAQAIQDYLQEHMPDEYDGEWRPRIVRWARLRLPNGQIARSLWKEGLKSLSQVRMARNIKVSCWLFHL
jgi:hypothetical protein